ncbi:MAG: DUF5119 domain-containing protein [Bacteroidales bacterium]|jgi:hypothetical protein|nr:DUF5119 domain-containing protein [Bacteroidales bacterium]
MKARRIITLGALLLLVCGCRIDPPLYLRKVIDVEVEVDAAVNVDVMWQVDWEVKWDYAWNVEALGPVGYEAPASMRLHSYPHDAEGGLADHQVHNFVGEQSRVQLTAGVYDFLFHSNDSEAILFQSNDKFDDVYAYTRVISNGLKESSLVQTGQQKRNASLQGGSVQTKADDGDGGFSEDPVVLMPDCLYALYAPGQVVSDNPDNYEYINGHYVFRIRGDLHPVTYIYLIQVHLLNNNGRVVGSAGGCAMTGMAEGADLQTGVNATTRVSVPTDLQINPAEDPDLLGARLISFGLPGCNPYDAQSVAASTSRHYLVLSISYSNGSHRNIHVDIADQVRALPLGGVISLELDVDDFPPEEGGGGSEGGFNALIGDWEEETGSHTIVN